MKLLKWLLPVLLVITFAPFCNAQMQVDDSLAILNLRDQLGLTTVGGLASPVVSSWAPTYIDTVYDPANANYRITRIDFGGLVATTSPSILPEGLFNGDSLSLVEELLLDSVGIDSIEGYLRDATTGPLTNLAEIDLSFNEFPSGNYVIFRYLMDDLDSLEILRAESFLVGNPTLFSDYDLGSSEVLEHFDISDNQFTGTLDVDLLVPVGSGLFENLLFLYADDNLFSTLQAPTTLSVSTTLQKLSINNIRLLDFKPIETLVNNIPNIRWVYAENAMDTVNVQDSLEFAITITNPIALRILDISHNKLVGKLPADFFERLPNIETLLLNNNLIRGFLPNPVNSNGGSFSGNAYLGLEKLKVLDLSHNQLKGDLHIDWFFVQQFDNAISATTAMPIQGFYVSNNKFRSVQPILNTATANTILTDPDLSNRFSLLREISIEGNRLDFKDLFRIKQLFKLKQSLIPSFFDHYVPQDGVDTMSFTYTPQDDLGIGGVRRRTPNSQILITAGSGIVAEEQTTINYIDNQYAWQRIDTAGIIGGTPASPTIQPLGLAEQVGGSTTPVLISNNTSGDPSYLFGVDTTPRNIHKLAIQNLDSASHHNWLYQAQIKNDSFPLLTLLSVPKKVEVGYCTDSSGQRVHCQSMIVQFHPDTLAQYSPLQQDSLKNALREELGAEPIDECLCGDIELWSISDTAKAMLEANGKGTKSSATAASGKPQLLSADPNYSLLSNTSNALPDTVSLPAGSGNSSAKTLVAIIDSGVDYEYTALTPYISEGASSASTCLANATFGYNFIGKNNNATDDHGHGTAVAGIVAGISQQSILPDTGSTQTDIGILPLKYTDKKGAGSVFHAACALRYAADYERTNSNGETAKVRVINASWGYYGDPCIVLENVLKYVGEDCGVLVVASAGNDGLQVQGAKERRHWPSNSIFDPSGTLKTDNILSVAGLNQSRTALHSQSNYGNVQIDIAAPWFENAPLAGSINGFNTVGGTSFAAPQVARAAALLFDKYPDATYFAVKHALMNGVDLLQHPDSNNIVSKGQINYYKADSILNRITNKFSCSDSSFTVNVKQIETIEDQVKIYPNPVQDNLTIEFDYQLSVNKIELNLFSVQGQTLQSQQLPIGTTNATLRTKELPAGIYFIRLTVDGQQYSKKIVKF